MYKVSFAKIIAVSAKPKKMSKLHKKAEPHCKTGQLIVKDVTDVYDNAASNGIMAQAVQRGEEIDLFVTGSDVQKMKNKLQGWKTMNELVAKIDSYIDGNRKSSKEIVQDILDRD